MPKCQVDLFQFNTMENLFPKNQANKMGNRKGNLAPTRGTSNKEIGEVWLLVEIGENTLKKIVKTQGTK